MGVLNDLVNAKSIGVGVTASSFTASGTVRAAFLKTTSTSQHAATIYQAGTSGTSVALNVTSDNHEDSAMYLSGIESGRGTLKIAHRKPGVSDASAAGLSIDLQGSGTAAQGIFITGTDGPTTGNLLTLRNNARDDFVVKGTGRIGIGIGTGSTPAGQVEIAQSDTSTVGLAMTAIASGQQMILLKDSSGNARFEINNSGNAVFRALAYYTSTVQFGSTSAQLGGGGTGCIGITNRGTVPTTNPTGGGVMYAENGALMWRGSSGTVTTVAPA